MVRLVQLSAWIWPLLWPAVAWAEAPLASQPLRQAELRALVDTGQILRLAPILDMVARHRPGTALDAQAFGGPRITYVVLISELSGRVAPVLIDARTGSFLDLDTPQAQSITRALQRAPPGTGLR